MPQKRMCLVLEYPWENLRSNTFDAVAGVSAPADSEGRSGAALLEFLACAAHAAAQKGLAGCSHVAFPAHLRLIEQVA